jgi:hypothetical protein
MLDIRKLVFCCFCSLAVLASTGLAGNVVVNGNLAVDSSGWTYLAMTTATGLMHADYDGATGNPGGSEKLWADANDFSTNNHRFGQVLRVNKGQKYKLDADWKGDLTGLANDPTYGASSRNWVEVFVGFSDTYPTSEQWGSIAYKKTYGGGGADTPWDWTSILSSPDSTYPAPQPVNGVFTATGKYMTVAFNLGGRIHSCDPTHPAWVYIDNIKVLPCHDAAGTDCSADGFRYIAWIANNWLACNIDPVTSCW